MNYTIIIKPSAERELDRLPRPARLRILDELESLRTDPRPPASKKLAGAENLWRIRVGVYRVVYEVKGEKLLIVVLRVGHRKDVYRKGN